MFFFGTKMLDLKDGAEPSSLCKLKSSFTPKLDPKLDSFDLKGAVLLVTAARLKIQTNPVC